MLIDTGADVTMLPRQYVEELNIEPEEDKVYEVQGFDEQTRLVQMVQLELIFLKRKFSGQFLLTDQPMEILGRNILNSMSIVFDGPHSKRSESVV